MENFIGLIPTGYYVTVGIFGDGANELGPNGHAAL